jgi:hypothetical protein
MIDKTIKTQTGNSSNLMEIGSRVKETKAQPPAKALTARTTYS